MNKYHIRFNRSRGQEGRGTMDHVWRVFENGEEYLAKHVRMNVPTRSEVTGNGAGGDDWNIACEGYMTVEAETATVIINATRD
jgi:hypothetical protein